MHLICAYAGFNPAGRITYTLSIHRHETEPAMLDPKIIEDLSHRLSDAVPQGARALKQDLERNFRAVLNSAFTRLDLVTREELEVQENLLARTRERLDELKARVDELEQRLQGGT